VRTDDLVVAHPLYLALGRTPIERLAAYRALVGEAIPAEETDAIHLNLQRQHAFGSRRLQATIEAQLQRRAGPARIGRPRKAESAL
jgi:putative transposase